MATKQDNRQRDPNAWRYSRTADETAKAPAEWQWRLNKIALVEMRKRLADIESGKARTHTNEKGEVFGVMSADNLRRIIAQYEAWDKAGDALYGVVTLVQPAKVDRSAA